MAGVGVGMSVGERLRAAREAKKITLEDVHRVTKIHKSILQAIEENRVEDVLDPAYAKVSVKKYATFLGVDSSGLLQDSAAAAEGPKLTVQTEITVQRERPSTLRWAVPAAALALGLVGLGVLGYLVVDLVGNLRQQRTLATQAAAAAAGASGGATTRLGSPGKPAEPELLVPLSKPLKLTLQTTADVWLQVKSDGAVVFQNVLSKGSRETWTAQKELELWTGNAGAMEMSLNGKPLERLARGVKKGVKVTHRGIE